MNVSLIAKTSCTLPLPEGEKTLSIGEFLAYVARVSNPQNQMNTETSPKLLNYCLRKGHWSVFEAASITMEIVTSRAIAQQILRHRSFTFQEFSQRYAEAIEREVYQARRQDEKNRQNSIDDMSDEEHEWFLNAQYDIWEKSRKLYKEALNLGIAKEQARFLLPLSTRTTIYMTGTVRSWIHYCDTRCAPGVQLEHRNIAKICKEILLGVVPELRYYFDEQKK